MAGIHHPVGDIPQSTGVIPQLDEVPAARDIEQNNDRRMLVSDVTAGVTVGLVALPLAMAFAIASGLSPQAGIYCAVVTSFIVSALGGSRVQIAGPTGAFVVVVAGIVSKYGVDGLFMCTVMAGVMLVVMRFTGWDRPCASSRVRSWWVSPTGSPCSSRARKSAISSTSIRSHGGRRSGHDPGCPAVHPPRRGYDDGRCRPNSSGLSRIRCAFACWKSSQSGASRACRAFRRASTSINRSFRSSWRGFAPAASSPAGRKARPCTTRWRIPGSPRFWQWPGPFSHRLTDHRTLLQELRRS
jgi:sulfate permease family protein